MRLILDLRVGTATLIWDPGHYGIAVNEGWIQTSHLCRNRNTQILETLRDPPVNESQKCIVLISMRSDVALLIHL